jgi:transcriptional regulator GlxA family with amidase domain
VCDFLETVEQQFSAHSIEADERAGAMVRQIDEDVRRSRLVSSSVAELCAACGVPRRTLNRAFQNALGMGPATYLRRVRLNGARRALRQRSAPLTTVTDVALEFGFWHLGRFAEQYDQLFGESPHETLRRADRGIRKVRLPNWDHHLKPALRSTTARASRNLRTGPRVRCQMAVHRQVAQ